MSTICPRCNAANLPDSKLCTHCGAKLLAQSEDLTLDDIAVSQPASSQDASSGLQPGAVLNAKYKILGEIGKGGMGVVYRAEDVRLKRTVALKFLSEDLTGDAEARERFVHEAQAASELDHPNVCTVHEIDETPAGQMFIVMAFYKGESLKDTLARGPLAVEEAVEITIQLARGLEQAHRREIVHRDIKPANILITEDGVAKIVDFGLARLSRAAHLTRTGTTMGTAAYMSPEQAQGEAMDHRTDLWSLGVVFYEMLAGQLPFKGERQASLLYAIVHTEPQHLTRLQPAVPAELEKIVRRALEKKPESRYSSAAEMIRDLEAYQESRRMSATRPFSVGLLVRRLRSPRVAAAVVAVLVAIGALSTWLWIRQVKIHWARDVALPEIERLIRDGDAWRDSTEAYRLAERAEAVIPHDPRLAELFSQCSLKMNIRTTPPGAKIYMKEYRFPDYEWKYLGVSPLEKIRVPIGIFRWKIEKEGYVPVIAAAPSWDIATGGKDVFTAYDLARTLEPQGSIPPGMVRVAGAKAAEGEFEDFYIDAHEVSSRQFKEFISSGGYKNRKFWKHKFLHSGREIPWEAALKEFVDQSGQPGPATWLAGDFPEGQADYPVSGVSWYEAAAYAEFVGKSLPTAQHWGLALGTQTPLIMWPQLGGFAVFAPFSNFNHKGPVPVGSLPGITSYGATDMAGNVREWCWNETAKGRAIRGGAWDDNGYMFDVLSQAPPTDRSTRNGFRLALYPHPEKIPAAAFQLAKLGEVRDFYTEKPVPDPVFAVYKEQYAYDKTDLKARVESREESPEGWTLEKVTFDAAYGGERVIAYLFLPKNVSPPYQTVIYFPGSESVNQKSSKNISSYYEFPIFLSFLVKNGRAVLYPVYKGTFERGNDTLAVLINGTDGKSHQYTEVFAQEVKDLRRSIDYLETRQDIDSKKLAFYGMSWGGMAGAIIPAVEERFKASVLVAAGFVDAGRPETAQINYITRVKTPTLILNGKYDTIMPLETSSKPMFDLLGTPSEHKKMKLYDTDHIPPHNEVVKETLAWLDRYLGPVK